MPGLFGFLISTPLNGKKNDELYQSMVESLAFEHNEIILLHKEGNFFLGCSTLRGSKILFHHSDENHIFACHGDLFKTKIGDGQGEHAFKELIKFYYKHGNDIADKIEGDFNFVIYDKINKSLTIFNDRFGMRFLYYYADENIIIFAPEVKPLLSYDKIERKYNVKAIVNLLVIGFFLQDETYIDGIELLSPASRYVYTRGTLTKHKYWKIQFDDDIRLENLDDKLCDSAFRLLQNSVAKRVDRTRPVAIPLSAGFDSRLLLELSSRISNDILAVTYGDKDSHEILFAQKVADKLCLKNHHVICPDEEVLFRYSGLFTRLTHGSATVRSALLYPCINLLLKNAPVLMNGIFGGHMSIGSGSFRESDIKLALSPDEEVQMIKANRYLSPMVQDFFTEDFNKEIERNLENNIDSALRQSRKASRKYCNRRDHFYITNLLRRQSNHTNPWPYYFDTKLPFADYDLFDFYLSLPPELRIRHKIYFKIYTTKLSHLGDIPWISNSHIVKKGAHGFTFGEYSYRLRLNNAFKYYFARLTHGSISIKNRDFPYDWNHWYSTKKSLRTFYKNILLDQKTLSRGFLKREGIARLFHLMDTGERSFHVVDWLVTFELGCRYFFDNESYST